jgi:hypothetical protein
MNICLPIFDIIKLKSPFGSDQYGAEPPEPMCLWHHGVFLPIYNVDPKILTLGHGRDVNYYVARDDQAVFLKYNGYKAKAIGMPILYAKDDQEYSRIPNSLLVMPMHTTHGVKMDTSQCLAFLRDVIEYSKTYDYLLVSLHAADVHNGYWIKELEQLGINWVIGARQDDKNSLKRQRALFQQFDTVLTNGFGSHIPYALHFGCKVYVFGTPIAPTKAEIISKDSAWNKNRKAAEMYDRQRHKLEIFLSMFRQKPYANAELGSLLIGLSEKNRILGA